MFYGKKKIAGVHKASVIDQMIYHFCIMGNAGSRIFEALPVTATKNQDISGSAASIWITKNCAF